MKKSAIIKDLQGLIDGLSDLGYKGVEHLIALLDDRDPEFRQLAPGVLDLLNAIMKIEKREENIAKSMHEKHMLQIINEAEETLELLELALDEHNSAANTRLLRKLNKKFRKVIDEENKAQTPKP